MQNALLASLLLWNDMVWLPGRSLKSSLFDRTRYDVNVIKVAILSRVCYFKFRLVRAKLEYLTISQTSKS